jgi:uncharacterized membrane protein SpoIIM required for sporulation
VDVEAFVVVNDPSWRRLEYLINRGAKRLTGDEIDELVEQYQRAATHLSVVRSSSPDPLLVARLTALVARGRAAVTGAHSPMWRDVGRFALTAFPVAAYRLRWWWLGVAVVCNVFSVVLGFWIAGSPHVQASLIPPADVRSLVNHDFAGYYTDHTAQSFAFQVWTNNVLVSAIALISGILLGIPTILALFENQLNVGVIGGYMFAHGKGAEFFGLLLPHGMLELTAVYLAAAMGLRLGWTVIDPGRTTRGQALAEQGRTAMAIALGLIGMLAVSGAIEGFATGHVGITWVRIGIGALAEAIFWTYVILFGRRAVRAGETGDADIVPDAVPIAG